MVIININGINGYLFNIDITAKKKWLKNRGINKYYLRDLKMDILRYLKNQIEEEIYKIYNTNLEEANDEEFYKITKTPLFKKWLNVSKSKYIKLMQDNIILKGLNFNDDELKDGDIINYIIEPRND